MRPSSVTHARIPAVRAEAKSVVRPHTLSPAVDAARRGAHPELLWPGKYDERGLRRESPRTALPLEIVEVCGAPGAAPNLLVRGDNLLAMDALASRYAGKVDLVYIDPPFGTGSDFAFDAPVGGGAAASSRGQSGLAYGDSSSLGEYLDGLAERLARMRDLLSESGTIFVHVDWHVGHFVRCLLDEIFGADAFKNEIVWRYRRWPAKTRVFQRMHDVIYWYGKRAGDAHTWNPSFDELAPSTLATWGTKRQVADFSTGRRRPSQTEHESQGAPRSDVWDIGIIAPIAHERLGYPTQKPEQLLTRILEAASKPGDLVADFFCGSGTTLAVAAKLGRRFIGCDVGRHAIETARKRLLDVIATPEESLPAGGGATGRKEDIDLAVATPEESGPARDAVAPKKPRETGGGFAIAGFGGAARRLFCDRELAGSEASLAALVLDRYGAESVSASSARGSRIHGRKGDALIHLGPLGGPPRDRDVHAAIAEARARGARELHVLGWEFGLDAHRVLDTPRSGVRVRLLRVPGEILGRARCDLAFVDVPRLDAELLDGDEAVDSAPSRRVRLTGLALPDDTAVAAAIRPHLTTWSDWIEAWAVDWNFGGGSFCCRWSSYRAGRRRALALTSSSFASARAGVVVVKVVDVMGYETRISLAVR